MNRQYAINPRVGWRCIGGEIVVFNCENQQIAIWNETASILWEKISEGACLNELVEFLTSEYFIGKQLNRCFFSICFIYILCN